MKKWFTIARKEHGDVVRTQQLVSLFRHTHVTLRRPLGYVSLCLSVGLRVSEICVGTTMAV